MRQNGKSSAEVLLGCFFYLIIAATLGGFCTEYTVEFWGGLIKGVPVDVPFYVCMIAALFIGSLAVPAAILTWLISFVI
jgi:hypothetical protein